MRNFQMKQALGLAVSGTEVRLAHLVNQNGQIRIAGLERARLQNTLENQPADNEPSKLEDSEARDVFGVKESLGEKSFEEKGSRPNGPKAENGNSGNLEILYRLLEKYTQKKVRIAFNVPLSMVTYQRPELAGRPEGMDKDSDSSLAQEVVVGQDGGRLIMSYEKHPPTMMLMREVNDFLRGNLFLALMDSTEVALANLARRSYECEPGKVTAIIYIEDDFTRMIFLRGQDLFHVSSIIHENTASPDILEVIYRKLIYEQDEVQIPELATIFLAGKSSRINAAEFFAAHFETANVQYLSSSLVASSPATGTQAGLFSEFAVPIALAWKTLEPKSPSFIPTNLLPQDLLDQQQVLKLNYQGYVLLAITGFVAFFLTWQILNLNGSIREMRKKNSQLERLIANNQETVDRVYLLDNQCQRLSKSMALADSLGRRHDEFLIFLRKLNAGLGKVGNIWVDEIVTHGDGFSVQGSSMNRDAIPLLAEKLGNASLRQMTRMEADKQKWFGFSLERSNAPDSLKAFAQGLSTIDAARYAGNGKLILSKEGVRPAEVRPAPEATTPNANGMASSPIIPKPAQASIAVEAGKKREAVANGTTSAPPMVRQDYARRAVTTPPPVKSNAFDKNKTTAMTNAAATTRQADVPAPSTKIEPKTPAIFADNVTRTRPNEEKSSGVALAGQAGDPSKTSGAAPAQKLTNGAAAHTSRLAGAERQQFDEAADLRSVQMQPASSPAASVSTASRPENAPPEIFRGYSIEAATSYTKELAEQFVATYRKQGYDAAVERYLDERTNAQKYRVLIGAFATRPAAEQKAAQMAGILMKDYRVVGLK